MSQPLRESLPLLLTSELERISASVSLPATAQIFLRSITKFLPQLTEAQANNVADQILDFAGKVWKLQQESKTLEIVIEKIEPEKQPIALPSAGS